MRVLLTTDTVGGVWTFTREMCTGLLSSGHHVSLISLGRKASREQSAWSAAVASSYPEQFSYTALDRPLEWMADNTRAYADSQHALLRIAHDFGADLLHSNQFCFGALPLSIPKIVTAHSDVLSWSRSCRPQGLEDSAWLRCYRSLVDEGLRGASAVVAPTRWMADALSVAFPAAKKVQLIPNGRTLQPSRGKPRRMLQAVSAGRRWDEAKQHDLLEDLTTAMPVVLAGQMSLCGEGLCEADLLEVFRRSSIYIASSRYEPFGLAPLEAALCGCAVAANDIASLREVWGDAALYFSGRESLRKLLQRLADSPDELRSAARRSEQRAQHLSAEKMVQGYLDLYTDLVAEMIPFERPSPEAYAC